MTSTFLQSKLHLLRVTSADLDYEGSLAIDPAIMEAAGVRPFEKILVANRENGARAETYAIPAARGSRTVCMNGAMAHLGKAGDRIIVFTFCELSDDEASRHVPRVALFGPGNELLGFGPGAPFVDEAADAPGAAEPDWAAWRPAEEATLLFAVRDDGAMLFIRKKRGLGAGLFNGPGGRLEPGETPLQAAIRETREEVRIDVRSAVRAGSLRFDFADGYRLAGHVFLSRDWAGTPEATDEADPVWFRPAEIPYDRMWKDDALWMPRMLEGRYFDGRFRFDGQRMLTHRVAATPPGVRLR